jgi:predicted nucleic acid-binding protein
VSLAYFDTSALVKNYIQEAGSTRVRELLGAYEFVSSAIAPIELHSAVRRRHRQGELNRQNYASILSRVKQDRSFWQLVEPVPPVLTKAEEIVVAYNVRSLDAIHLASAIIIQDSIGTPLPFITADERQFTAARDCKLETIAVTR